MSHVFISYVRENKADVERLAIALREHGISVWIDRNNIAAGVRWQKAIVDGIKNGAYFIACFSRELAARGETYMLEELNVALDRLRSMPSDRIWLIPLMLNETEIPSIPISRREDINDIQHIRMFEDWEAGITDILKIVDPKYCRVMHLASLVVDHPPERLHAVKELACMGSAVSPALSALRTALRDTDSSPLTKWAPTDSLPGAVIPRGIAQWRWGGTNRDRAT
jgi:hypothetical protein